MSILDLAIIGVALIMAGVCGLVVVVRAALQVFSDDFELTFQNNQDDGGPDNRATDCPWPGVDQW